VNLRFVIFSAQWRVYLEHLPRGRRVLLGYFLADLNLLVFQKAWPKGIAEPGQVAYAIGGATIWAVWQVASIVGICAASLVPVHWGLGFAGTLSMLGLAYGLLVDRKAQLAAIVAAAAAIAAFALPLKLNILVAIAAAVAAGELMDRTQRATRRMPDAA
jgi:predicted branched-subunit amino acid permease